jgi:hypothetical protein
MARLSNILIPSCDLDIKYAALGASTAHAAESIGFNRIFVINADQDITTLFGNSTVAAPSATSYRIPANQQTVFDMGAALSYIRVFNLSSTTAANVWIKLLSVM